MDKLTQRMQNTVDTSFEDIDAILFVLSARDRVGGGDRFIARRVYGLSKPRHRRRQQGRQSEAGHIITQMKAAAQLGDFHALHPVSAKTRDGIDELRSDLVHLLPEGSLLPARVGDRPDERGADLGADPREGATADPRRGAALDLGQLDELDEKLLRAFVLVETESQKQILVGKKGAMIREISATAPSRSRRCSGTRSSLGSSSKVRPKWRRDDAALERLGL